MAESESSFERIIRLKVHGHTDREIVKKVGCTLADIRAAMAELAREMLQRHDAI